MNKPRHWILLRGLGRDERHWGDFVRLFEQHFPDDKVTTLDTCGNGRFARMRSPLKINHYTEHCRQRLQVDEREVHLVALSLGGMIAMDWAQRYADEVQSVTLINTSASNLTSVQQRINFKTLSKLIWAVLVKRDSVSVEKAILAATSNNQVSQEIVSQWAQFRESNTTSITNLLRQLFAASQFKLAYPTVEKIKVLTSKKDRLVSYKAGEAIARHLECELAYHDEAGHDLPLDDGGWIIEQIKMSSIGHQSERNCQ